MDMLFEMTLAGKLCTFMLSFELKANTCTAVGALKSMPSVRPPPPHDVALQLKAVAVLYCELGFSPLSSGPFHNNASFALFSAVESGWMRRWGGGGGVGFYRYCSMLSAWARPRLRMWTGTISGCSEVGIATSQITTALISAKNNAKKTFFWNKFSTLDVSYPCPLCSIGSYFGEAWVLLSNLLSCLQMKVSGGATHEKLLSPFWSGQIVLTRLKKKIAFCPSIQACVHVWLKKDCLPICSFFRYIQEWKDD